MIICSKLNSILCSVWISILSCPMSCVVWCSALRWCVKFYSILSCVLLYFVFLWWAEFYSAFYSIRFFCGVLSPILFCCVLFCYFMFYSILLLYYIIYGSAELCSVKFFYYVVLCFLFYCILFSPICSVPYSKSLGIGAPLNVW